LPGDGSNTKPACVGEVDVVEPGAGPIAAADSAPRPDHPVADLSQKQIKRRPGHGGLINEYGRAA
jgi:hypothetical protein